MLILKNNKVYSVFILFLIKFCTKSLGEVRNRVIQQSAQMLTSTSSNIMVPEEEAEERRILNKSDISYKFETLEQHKKVLRIKRSCHRRKIKCHKVRPLIYFGEEAKLNVAKCKKRCGIQSRKICKKCRKCNKCKKCNRWITPRSMVKSSTPNTHDYPVFIPWKVPTSTKPMNTPKNIPITTTLKSSISLITSTTPRRIIEYPTTTTIKSTTIPSSSTTPNTLIYIPWALPTITTTTMKSISDTTLRTSTTSIAKTTTANQTKTIIAIINPLNGTKPKSSSTKFTKSVIIIQRPNTLKSKERLRILQANLRNTYPTITASSSGYETTKHHQTLFNNNQRFGCDNCHHYDHHHHHQHHHYYFNNNTKHFGNINNYYHLKNDINHLKEQGPQGAKKDNAFSNISNGNAISMTSGHNIDNQNIHNIVKTTEIPNQIGNLNRNYAVFIPWKLSTLNTIRTKPMNTNIPTTTTMKTTTISIKTSTTDKSTTAPSTKTQNTSIYIPWALPIKTTTFGTSIESTDTPKNVLITTTTSPLTTAMINIMELKTEPKKKKSFKWINDVPLARLLYS